MENETITINLSDLFNIRHALNELILLEENRAMDFRVRQRFHLYSEMMNCVESTKKTLKKVQDISIEKCTINLVIE